MDKLCWWGCNGRCYSSRRHVPALATNPSPGRVVPLPGFFGSHWTLARHLRHTTYILHYHHPSGKSWYMDISPSICRCRIRKFSPRTWLPCLIRLPPLYLDRLFHPTVGVGPPEKEVEEEKIGKIGERQECEQRCQYTRLRCR